MTSIPFKYVYVKTYDMLKYVRLTYTLILKNSIFIISVTKKAI